MDGNWTLIKALEFLSDSDIGCNHFFSDGSTTSSICCLDVFECLDMSVYPELLFDEDYYQDDITLCWHVTYFPSCFTNLRSICLKYENDLATTFNQSAQTIMDRYADNLTCEEDSGDYNWSEWTDYYTDPTIATETVSGSDNGALVGGILGASIVLVAIILLVVYFVRRRKSNKDDGQTEGKPEDNPAYHMEHRPSAEYDFIHENEIRYVKMELGREEVPSDTEISSSYPGYDGLSNLNRSALEKQYSSLSNTETKDNFDYITSTDSVHEARISRLSINERPNSTDSCKKSDHDHLQPQPNSSSTKQPPERDVRYGEDTLDHDYFEPQPELPTPPPLPKRDLKDIE